MATPTSVATACASCYFGATSSTLLSYTQEVIETIEVSIQPYITIFPNGSASTSYSTTTFTVDIVPTAGAPASTYANPSDITWTYGGETLTYPTTYVSYEGFARAQAPTAGENTCSAQTSQTEVALPPDVNTESLIYPLPANVTAIALPGALLDYLDSLPEITGQISGTPLTACAPLSSVAPVATSTVYSVPAGTGPARRHARPDITPAAQYPGLQVRGVLPRSGYNATNTSTSGNYTTSSENRTLTYYSSSSVPPEPSTSEPYKTYSIGSSVESSVGLTGAPAESHTTAYLITTVTGRAIVTGGAQTTSSTSPAAVIVKPSDSASGSNSGDSSGDGGASSNNGGSSSNNGGSSSNSGGSSSNSGGPSSNSGGSSSNSGGSSSNNGGSSSNNGGSSSTNGGSSNNSGGSSDSGSGSSGGDWNSGGSSNSGNGESGGSSNGGSSNNGGIGSNKGGSSGSSNQGSGSSSQDNGGSGGVGGNLVSLLHATDKPTPTPAPVFTVGSSTLSTNAVGQYVYQGETLTPGSPIVAGTGHAFTAIVLQTTGGSTQLIVNGNLQTGLPAAAIISAAGSVSTAVFTANGQPFTAVQSGGSVVIAGASSTISLAAGAATTFAGQSISAPAAGDGVVVVNGKTITPAGGSAATSVFTANGQTFTAVQSSGSIVLAEGSSTITLAVGSATTFDGQSISAASGGGVVVNGQTITPAPSLASATGAVFTANGHTITAAESGSSIHLVDGSSSTDVRIGETVTFDGETIVAASGGSSLVIDRTSTVSLMPMATLASTTRGMGDYINSGLGSTASGAATATGGNGAASTIAANGGVGRGRYEGCIFALAVALGCLISI